MVLEENLMPICNKCEKKSEDGLRVKKGFLCSACIDQGKRLLAINVTVYAKLGSSLKEALEEYLRDLKKDKPDHHN